MAHSQSSSSSMLSLPRHDGCISSSTTTTTTAVGSTQTLVDTEKAAASTTSGTWLDGTWVLGLSKQDEAFYREFSDEARKRITRKIDWRFLPVVSILQMISQIDRTNIGNAKIEGLYADLHMDDMRWGITLAVFFIPYMIFEIPSNMLIKKLKRPSRYLGLLVASWGCVIIGHAFVRNTTQLIVARVFLGVLEAGLYPGLCYLCSYWYMPEQLAIRFSCLWVSSALSGAFSGMVASTVGRLKGVLGLSGWRWIFLIDGMMTVVLGFLAVFLLVDSAETSRQWLSNDEIKMIQIQKLVKEGGAVSVEDSRKRWYDDLRAIAMNWRLHLKGLVLVCAGTASWGTKVTLPTITKAMGFTNTTAQLLSCPPYIAAAVTVLAFGYLSDRYYLRMPFAAASLGLIIVGFIMLVSTGGHLQSNVALTMTAAITACMGFYPFSPIIASWTSNNLAPASRRAVGLAYLNSVAALSGIFGSFLFQKGGPHEVVRGFAIGLGLAVFAMVLLVGLEVSYVWANTSKEKSASGNGIGPGPYSACTEDQMLRMGEKSPRFRYTL